MYDHFDRNLNLKSLILKNKPITILELGAGSGDTTKLLLSILDERDKLIVVNDAPIDLEGIEFIQGISYDKIRKLSDDSIDLALIDTDHNYWTLDQELTALRPKLKEGGFIAMHDVSTFYHDTGMSESYHNGFEYPSEVIEACGKKHGGLGDALVDFLANNKMCYRLAEFNPESHGVALIQKQTVNEFKVSKGTLYAPRN